jgi:hypothetical protein
VRSYALAGAARLVVVRMALACVPDANVRGGPTGNLATSAIRCWAVKSCACGNVAQLRPRIDFRENPLTLARQQEARSCSIMRAQRIVRDRHFQNLLAPTILARSGWTHPHGASRSKERALRESTNRSRVSRWSLNRLPLDSTGGPGGCSMHALTSASVRPSPRAQGP